MGAWNRVRFTILENTKIEPVSWAFLDYQFLGFSCRVETGCALILSNNVEGTNQFRGVSLYSRSIEELS
jgi:hypothetical protein